MVCSQRLAPAAGGSLRAAGDARTLAMSSTIAATLSAADRSG